MPAWSPYQQETYVFRLFHISCQNVGKGVLLEAFQRHRRRAFPIFAPVARLVNLGPFGSGQHPTTFLMLKAMQVPRFDFSLGWKLWKSSLKRWMWKSCFECKRTCVEKHPEYWSSLLWVYNNNVTATMCNDEGHIFYGPCMPTQINGSAIEKNPTTCSSLVFLGSKTGALGCSLVGFCS